MRQITGFGKVNIDGFGELESAYVLKFENDGKTTLFFDFESFTIETMKLIDKMQGDELVIGQFSGTTEKSDTAIEASHVVLTKFDMDSQKGIRLEFQVNYPLIIYYESLNPQDEVEIRYGLTNFFFFGHETTRRGNRFSRDTISINIEKREIRFTHLENYQEIEHQLRERKDVQITSEMIINGNYSELADIEEIANNIKWTCSLASANYVTDLYQDIYKNGRLAKTILKPSKTYPYISRSSAIDASIRGGDELRSFLTITYPRFTELKEELGLEIVIEYYISSRLGIILEIGFLLGMITLECIESYLSSYFKSRGIAKDLSNFKSKTRALLDEFGVSYKEDELEIKDTRDKIVHTGRFPSERNPYEEYTKIINLLDRVLLIILGYKGNMYYNLNSRAKEILI